MMLGYLLVPMQGIGTFYFFCFFLGFCNGYWTLFIVMAVELFGTNIRATVARLVPNFVRGATVPFTAIFCAAEAYPGQYLRGAADRVGAGVVVASLLALHFLEETYAKELDYIEPQ